MELRIIHHRSEKVERMRVDIENDGHAGGDLILAESFLDLVKERARPNASLRDGLLSAAMCLAARESARTKTFQRVLLGSTLPKPAHFSTLRLTRSPPCQPVRAWERAS
jgi:hypothetical protein